MKREFEFQPEPGNSLGGPTPTYTTQSTSSPIEVYDTVNNNCKRFKGSLVNGLIVYTRERKSRFNWSSGLSENGHHEQLRSSDEPEINVSASVEERRDGKEVQIVDGDHPVCKDKELVRSPAKEGGPAGNIVVIAAQSCEGKNDFPEKEVRSFKPSAIRPKVKPEPTESLVNASEAAQNEANLYLDGEATGGVHLTPKNKLELKMSKKIALNKKPMTVRELFDTGLLDGVTVVYMGCHKVVLMILDVFKCL